MMRLVVGLLMLFTIAPVCRADDLTDAMVNTDPRDRLETGQGAAFSAVYGPKTEEAPSPEAPEREETTPEGSYGSYYGDLRSSLTKSQASPTTEDDTALTTLPKSRLSLPSQEEQPLSGGVERDGVWYGDGSAP